MKKRLLILLTLVFTLFTLASCNIGNLGKPAEKPDVGEEDDFDFNNITLLSAYSKAKDLGFSGTLEEFVEMLSGKDGADGKDGEDGIGIEKVEFDKDGNLLITYTDGSTQTVTVPKKEEHLHKFGEWKKHTYGLTVPCDELLSFRICSECSYTEWKEGTMNDHSYSTVTTNPTCSEIGFDTKTCATCGKVVICNEKPVTDHSYPTEYKCEGDFHWKECIFCGNVTEKGEHTRDEDGICTVCYSPITDTVGVIYDVSLDGTYAEVVDYQGTATKVKIASEYKGLPVKTIYENAFKNKDSITSVIIPDSVTSIGDDAFYDCDGLTSVEIGNGVTSIGDEAFYSCYRLTSVVVPDSVTSIGSWAFYNCSSLTSVVIPDSVTSIGEDAFRCCSSLTSIEVDENNGYYKDIDGNLYTKDGKTLVQYAIGKTDTSFTVPDGVETIGSGAFVTCSSLTSVEIPDSVTSIGSYAFAYCDSLTSIKIGKNLANVSSSAFSGVNSALFTEYEYGRYVGDSENPYKILVGLVSKNLSTYEIHEDTQVIGGYVFSGCSRLTSITIPDKVIGISDYAFYNCSSLTSVVIGDSVTSIGSGAFAWCDSLTSVVIGDSVTFIGSGAFAWCDSLTSVTFENTEGWWVSRDSDAASGTEISATSLANPSTAAYYLRSTYCYYYWFCDKK